MSRQIGSLGTAVTLQIETLPKSISTSITNYPIILLGNSVLSVRGQMPYNKRFREINSFMHFPHFDLFYKRWRKWVTTKQKKCCLLVTPTWQSQIWHPVLLQMFIVHPLQIPRNTSLKNSLGEVHPLTANRTLRLAVWTISGKSYFRRKSQNQLPNLLQVQAISAVHDYVDGKPVGQHPEVCDPVSGIFDNRPPQPLDICFYGVWNQ